MSAGKGIAASRRARYKLCNEDIRPNSLLDREDLVECSADRGPNNRTVLESYLGKRGAREAARALKSQPASAYGLLRCSGGSLKCGQAILCPEVVKRSRETTLCASWSVGAPITKGETLPRRTRWTGLLPAPAGRTR